MASQEVSSCITIHLDHAYAAATDGVQCMVKTENDSEPEHSIEIKMEEVSIKTELPEEFETSSTLSCEPDLEDFEIKQEQLEDPLSISDSLCATVSVSREIFFAMEKELQMNKEDMKKLSDYNCTLLFENKSLKAKINQLKQPPIHNDVLEKQVVQLQNEISYLQAENQTYQTKISAFEEPNKYQQSVEKQVMDLKSKLLDFTGVVLPSMEESHIKEIKQLKYQVDIKDKQIDYLNVKIDSLSSALLSLKEKIDVTNEAHKSNYLKQVIRADDLKTKLKAIAQTQSITEIRFKMRESNLWRRKLEAENETKSVRNIYEELKLKWNVLVTKESLMSKEIQKLKTFLKDAERTASQKNYINVKLHNKIKVLGAKVKQLSTCKYCGL